MRQYLTFLLFVLCLSACGQHSLENNSSSISNSTSNTKTEFQIKALKEREETFTSFQKYVDAHYPNWKLKGISKEEYNYSDSGQINLSYALLIADKTYNKSEAKANRKTDDKLDNNRNDKPNEKIIVIISASFELSDGTTETHLFEPDKQTIRRLQRRKQKEQNKEEGKEDMTLEMQERAFEDSYDPVNDR